MKATSRFALCAALACWAASPRSLDAADPSARNLVFNGGFEEDLINLRGERMSCPVRQRTTYGQSDATPDGWGLDQLQANHASASHSGSFAALVKSGPTGTKLTQTFSYAVQTKELSALPPLHFSAWVKGEQAGASGTLTLTLDAMNKEAKALQPVVTVNKPFTAAEQWTHLEFDIPAAQVAAAIKTPPAGNITCTLTIQASAGAVAVDDVEVLVAPQALPYTLVANGGFEAAGNTRGVQPAGSAGYPADWSEPKKALRYFGENYYVWRDWFHFFGKPRGANSLDRLVVSSGKHSMHMNVPPGDDKYVESGAITLNQPQARRMVVQFDYNTYLLANLFVQIVNEEGKEVFAQNIMPGNSSGWRTFRAEFMPRKSAMKPGDIRGGGDLFGATGDALALKGCRVRIGVKGVNGSEMDDINEWVNVNHAGAAWIDNVVLAETESTAAEMTSRGAKTFGVDHAPAPVSIASIDLGERLYGQNAAKVVIANSGGAPVNGHITMTISGPYFERDPQKSGYAVGAVGQDTLEPEPEKIKEQTVTANFSAAPGARAEVNLPYTITQLLPDWRSEYRVKFSTGRGPTTDLTLGTWSQQALVEVERCYSFPDVAKLPVFMNVGVARQTLRNVDRLHLEIHRARDNAKVSESDLGGFQQLAAKFNVAPLPILVEGTEKYPFEGDNTNFVLTDIEISKLPMHSQTRPERDHYLVVTGLDSASKPVFEGRSPRFGRMEVHNEQLAAISTVSVSPHSYLVVNGKPLFTRGHIWMQQNFGPSPLARKDTKWKTYGFNLKAGTQMVMPEPAVNELWSTHNTYLGSQMIAPQPPLTPATKSDIAKWLGKPNVIGVHFVPWEGMPTGPQDAFLQYAKDIKSMIQSRPLWVSTGWYAPRVRGMYEPCLFEHDWFAPENNAYFQPSQLDKELLSRKKNCVLNTYPNVFNDTPYMVQRFEHWTEIIRHHTGYQQIGKPGDPTLMAGMNGEFRFIESFLFNEDGAPRVTASPNVEHMARAGQKANYVLATNAGPTIGGDWRWSSELRDKGRASHTGTAIWSRMHDYMKDYYSHFFKDDQPVTVKNGDKIVQYVYLPPGAPVDSLVLMVRGNGEWRYQANWGNFDHKNFTDSGVRLWMAKDMHQMAWGSIDLNFCGVEGHDIHNPQLIKHTFTPEQFHSMGALPAAGKWVRLEVPVETLGLDGQIIDGFGFVSKKSPVWWERTLLVQNGNERVLCDGSAGIPPEQLKKVRFNVPGLKAGTKVAVCFEERDLVAQDGYFEDDLSGEPGYRNLWVGIYGDKLGETGYYGDGIMYNYNWGKVAARLYEIPK